jgi:dihydrofolate reductase
MRKLKLQMQITVDGYVAGPQGQLDWMTFDMDDRLLAFINEMIDTSDTILLGRKMTTGFVNYWEDVISKPQNPEYAFGQKMVRTAKIVFSKAVDHMNGTNVQVEKGDLVEAVNRLKRQTGKDLIVYGGATFVSSLIDHGLIDELNLFVNPVAIADGMRIFHGRRPLALTRSTVYPCGIVVNTYRPK